MKWKAYPKYKPSGVEWLGEVPEHWATKRLKYSAQLINEKVEAGILTSPISALSTLSHGLVSES